MSNLIDRLKLPRAPEAGELAVVMSWAGVGKTSFLMQVALAELLSGRDVVHIALGQTLRDVQRRYDTLFANLADATGLPDRDAAHAAVASRRAIQAIRPGDLSPDRLQTCLKSFQQHLDLHPSMVLIDGFDWTAEGGGDLLVACKELARGFDTVLWLSAPVHREAGKPGPLQLYPAAIDLAVSLEPDGSRVRARLLKTFDLPPPEPALWLDPTTLLAADAEPALRTGLGPASGFTLLSGGAQGAEAEFGACAEKYGVFEKHFSFAGRKPARTRGLVLLTPDDLRQGDVSRAYLESRMKRKYRKTEDFKKVLQSIWCQVNPAGEVFVVGVIKPDKTVKGGTGWAVELAKHQKKPVHVYDQDQKGWFAWTSGDWRPAEPPAIRCTRFAGTGTRSVTPEGKRAIRELFERTFGS